MEVKECAVSGYKGTDGEWNRGSKIPHNAISKKILRRWLSIMKGRALEAVKQRRKSVRWR